MKNRITIGIFFFLFLLTASGVFAAMVGNSRQGLPAISVTSQPGSTEKYQKHHQGLTCILLNPVSGGAFITKDPIGFNGGMNLYRYADNNPLIYTDPMGFYKNLGTTLLSALPYSNRSIYGNTIPSPRLDVLGTNFDNGICTIAKVEYHFSQIVYYPKIGENFIKPGLLFSTNIIANKAFAETVKRHELVHAVSNQAIADLVFPKGERNLIGKTKCTSSKGECDSWANSLANSYITEFNSKRTTAGNKWHEILVYGSGLNSYSPAQSANYFNWFYPWLGQ